MSKHAGHLPANLTIVDELVREFGRAEIRVQLALRDVGLSADERRTLAAQLRQVQAGWNAFYTAGKIPAHRDAEASRPAPTPAAIGGSTARHDFDPTLATVAADPAFTGGSGR